MTISSTTIVAAPAGFTGLAKWPGYLAKRDAVARRDALAADSAAAAAAVSTNFLLPTIAPAARKVEARKAAASRIQYPWAVQCTRSITYFTTKTTTKTVPTSTITLSVQTLWQTMTIPATKTVTIIPADATS